MLAEGGGAVAWETPRVHLGSEDRQVGASLRLRRGFIEVALESLNLIANLEFYSGRSVGYQEVKLIRMNWKPRVRVHVGVEAPRLKARRNRTSPPNEIKQMARVREI